MSSSITWIYKVIDWKKKVVLKKIIITKLFQVLRVLYIHIFILVIKRENLIVIQFKYSGTIDIV